MRWLLIKTLEALEFCTQIKKRWLGLAVALLTVASVLLVGPWWSLLLGAVVLFWVSFVFAWAMVTIASDPYDIWDE